MNHRVTIFVVLLSASLVGCEMFNKKAPSGKFSWDNVLSSCGVGDLQKSKPLYFGAGNANGVGTIWSFDETTKDYFPTSQLKDLTDRSDIVYENFEIECKGDVRSGIEFDVGLSAKPVVYPFSAEIKSSIGNASSAKVSVEKIVQEDAFWDRFNEEFDNLPAESRIKKGVELNNRYVIGRAWKIKGFKAVLSYQNNSAASAKAALDAKIGTGDLGMSVKQTSDNTLEISSPHELYIAGVLRKLSTIGVSASSADVVMDWVEVPDNANINPPLK